MYISAFSTKYSLKSAASTRNNSDMKIVSLSKKTFTLVINKLSTILLKFREETPQYYKAVNGSVVLIVSNVFVAL